MSISEEGTEAKDLKEFSGSFDMKFKKNKSFPNNEIFINNSSNFLFSLKNENLTKIEKNHGERIFDFESLTNSRLLLLTEDGYLILKKKEEGEWREKSFKKINLGEVQGTCIDKIAICPEEKIVAVCVNNYTKISKILFFKIFKNKLVFKSSIDFSQLGVDYFEDLKFHNFEQNDRKLVLTGISNYTTTKFYTFVLDKRNFKLLKMHKKETELHHPSDLHQVEESLMGIDGKGYVFRVGC